MSQSLLTKKYKDKKKKNEWPPHGPFVRNGSSRATCNLFHHLFFVGCQLPPSKVATILISMVFFGSRWLYFVHVNFSYETNIENIFMAEKLFP
jgi:hypothetical protein